MNIEDRSTYIGGSAIPAIMGLESDHPYGNWTEVWKRLTTPDYPDHLDNGHIRRGNALEPHIEAWVRENYDPSINAPEHFDAHDTANDPDDLRFYEEGDELGNPINVTTGTRAQIFIQDKKQPYLRGHCDGIGDEMIHEMKAPTHHNVEYIRRYGCKWSYIVQCQLYMMITGKRRGAIHIWDSDAWKPITFEIKRDEALHKKIRANTRAVWTAIQNGEDAPDLRWQKRMGYEHTLDHSEVDGIASQYISAQNMKRSADAIIKDLKPKIMTFVNGVWSEGEKRVQFTTQNCHISCSEDSRGYRKLIVKENEITKEIPTT